MEENKTNKDQGENPKQEKKSSSEEKRVLKTSKLDNSSNKIIEERVKKQDERVYLINTLSDYLNKNLASDHSSYLTRFYDTTFNNNLLIGDSTLDNQLKLADEINNLKRKLKKSADDLKSTQMDSEAKIAEFEKLKRELTAKEKTSHILSRISEKGRKKLLDSDEFKDLFKNSTKCDAVVVSIDIRRSTELMLKARTPELFSKFITELSYKLSQIIISNFGIFDKFTGDGILAFFPKFYSGKEAIVRAIKASNECHLLFREHYNNSKDCFNVFIKDIGLGIGIDFGNVTLVNTQSELTVVGIPVVYACRFSGAKAGETLINQPAKEEVLKLCPTLASFHESEINIKNEGIAIGYNVSLNNAAYNIEDPKWDELIEQYKNE